MSGTELAKAAARLEKACKDVETDEIKAAYPLLIEAFDRFQKEAENFLESRK